MSDGEKRLVTSGNLQRWWGGLRRKSSNSKNSLRNLKTETIFQNYRRFFCQIKNNNNNNPFDFHFSRTKTWILKSSLFVYLLPLLDIEVNIWFIYICIYRWPHSFMLIKFVTNFRGNEDPATWAPKIGNSWRTTDDIQDNWNR